MKIESKALLLSAVGVFIFGVLFDSPKPPVGLSSQAVALAYSDIEADLLCHVQPEEENFIVAETAVDFSNQLAFDSEQTALALASEYVYHNQNSL